jgi:2'-5' RNA ligase
MGVPAHLTLLYPFLPPVELTPVVRTVIAQIAATESAFSYEMRGPTRWPDTIYVAVDPERPFLRLHAALAAAYPDYPIYGRPRFGLVPHITVAEGDCVEDPATLADPAWAVLPAPAGAAALEVIASNAAGRWRRVWQVPLAAGDHAGDPSRMLG